MANFEINNTIQDLFERFIDPPLGKIEESLSQTRENLLAELTALQKSLDVPIRRELCSQVTQEISNLVDRRTQEVEASWKGRLSSLVDQGNRILSGTGQSEILGALVEGTSLFAGRIILFLTRGESIVGWKISGAATSEDSRAGIESLQLSKKDENPVSLACIQGVKIQGTLTPEDLNGSLFQALPGRRPEEMIAFPIEILGKCPAILYADHHAGDKALFHPSALEFLVSLAQNKIELQAISRAIQKNQKLELKTSAFRETPLKMAVLPAETVQAAPARREPDTFAGISVSPVPEAVQEISTPPDKIPQPVGEEEGVTGQDLSLEFTPEEEMATTEESSPGESLAEPETYPEASSPAEEVQKVEEPEASEDIALAEAVNVEEEEEVVVLPFPEAVPETARVEPADQADTEKEVFVLLPIEEDLPETIKMPTLTPPGVPAPQGAAPDSTFLSAGWKDTGAMASAGDDVFSFTPEDAADGRVKMSLEDFLKEPPTVVPPTATPQKEQATAGLPVETPIAPAATVSSFGGSDAATAPTIFDLLPISPVTPQPEAKKEEKPAATLPAQGAEKGLFTGSTVDRLHADARRFARLLVSEIKLYNEQILVDARKNRNIYQQLKKAIDMSREHYSKRVSSSVTQDIDYFHEELVRMLCEGEVSLLGPQYPGPVTGPRK